MLKTVSLFLCLSGLAFAQSEVGGSTLNGTVTDPTGAAVAGAAVRVIDPSTGFTRAATSNDPGFYNFVRVPVGVYELILEHPGFRSVRRTNIRLDIGGVVTLDLRLEVGATQERRDSSRDAVRLGTLLPSL